MSMLDRYEEVVGRLEIDHLRRLGDRLRGKRVVHVNSTKEGGGVAEILSWMIPLMRELGIDARWVVIEGHGDFYRVTKAFHNGLQGLSVNLNQRDFELHRSVNEENARALQLEADVVFVHDPQPIFLPAYTAKGKVGRWIWRCHIDASRPNRAVWQHLSKAMPDYDAMVFSMAPFTRPLGRPMFLCPPSIDPLSEKNRSITEAERLRVLKRFRIDPERPLLLQVSRFDRFKDPLGVIEAFRLVKQSHPELQLALVGGPAADDPEGASVLAEVQQRAGEDPDLKVLPLAADSHFEVNALQRSAIVVLQKSLKEGFGLTVTEALWKGRPVIGGACGGITLQVHDYQTGFLVYSPAGAAYRIQYLLRYSEKRERMGQTGHDFVREHFLLTRHLRDYLSLLASFDDPDMNAMPAN